MIDLFMLALIVAAFAVAGLYVRFCARVADRSAA